MVTLKTKSLALAGAVVGVLTLRTLRRRRQAPEEDDEPPVEAIRSEAQAAVEHATAAVSHARVAGEHAVGYAKTEADERRATGDEDESEPGATTRVRRLRKAGKGWIRR